MIFNINVNVFKIANSILLDKLMVIVVIFIAMILSYFLLLSSNIFFKYLGKTGNLVISRMMSLILAAISIEFICKGIEDLIIVYL
ncbi:MAG: MarC family protein [Thermoplasmata archaeon]